MRPIEETLEEYLNSTALDTTNALGLSYHRMPEYRTWYREQKESYNNIGLTSQNMLEYLRVVDRDEREV